MDQLAWTQLSERGVVAVRGPDAARFLQNLVTNDIDRIHPGSAGYGALLTPQGKVLTAFIVFAADQGFLFEMPAKSVEGFASKLSLYRLRASVEISDLSADQQVLAWWGGGTGAFPLPNAAPDPRLPELGVRAIASRNQPLPRESESDPASYHRRRIEFGVPESGVDFALGEVFPHDANIDLLGGVDFGKGCYVGQEVVSRMQHRHTARRRVVKVTAGGPLRSGDAITTDGAGLGMIGSVDGVKGLAIVRIDRVAEAIRAGSEIVAGDRSLQLSIPDWAGFTWPEAEAHGDRP